jgi:3'(2'), 5'-bisphosphate nucleotidase
MYQRELQTAREAVSLAGSYLTKAYAEFHAIPNAPASITTDADRQAQEIILGHILSKFPGDALCAEEATALVRERASTGDRLWIVDPIDGTRGFAMKNGEFSVMVGFVDKGNIGVGVVGQPATARLTYAMLGAGCWRLDGGQAEPQVCRVTDVPVLAQATLTQSRSRNPQQKSPYLIALEPARVLESYSAGIKLALVARGEADIYLNTYDAFHDWDICAGHILVTEAGGQVTGIRGESLQYGLPEAWQRHGLLASNGKLHQESIRKAATLWK